MKYYPLTNINSFGEDIRNVKKYSFSSVGDVPSVCLSVFEGCTIHPFTRSSASLDKNSQTCGSAQ